MKIEEAIKAKFPNSVHKAVVNVMFTSNWLRDQQAQVFSEYDLLPQHFNVLRILLGKHPQPVSPGAIKEVMIDKGTDVTRLLNKLEERGLIERRICLENRRMIDVLLTAGGLALANELSVKVKETTSPYHEQLTPEEAELLSQLLDKLRG
jgi:DNA-binding MarR family transcriptional regulator